MSSVNTPWQEFEIEWQSQKHKVKALKQGSKLWFHFNGENFCLDLQNNKKSKATNSADLGEIYSPMPAKVVRINVKQGDVVEAKQVLMVLEAMKMEYSISAPKEAKVVKLLVSQGEQLKDAQLMIELAPLTDVKK